MDREIRAAVAYNKNRYGKSKTKLIQQLVGSQPDGRWGPNTVQAVMEWQDDNGLDDDGKVGPITFELMMVEFEEIYEDPIDLDMEQYMFMMWPTMRKESGGLKHPYKATNEDWERRGAFDTPKRHPDTGKRLTPEQRRQWRINNPERAEEEGYKAFWASEYQDDGSPGTHISLSGGAIQYATYPGSFGELLEVAHGKDRAEFAVDFGPHHEELLETTNAGKGKERVRAGLGPNIRADNCMPVGGYDLWEDYWVDRFEASAMKQYMIDAQIELSIEKYFKAAINICAGYGWHDQVSLAVVFDMCVQFGPGRVRIKGGKIDRKWSKGTREYLAVAKQRYGKDAGIMQCLKVLSEGHQNRRQWVAGQMNEMVRYDLTH